MYTASEKFKAHTDSSVVRRPKSKIIVGDVTYTGETALISYPKITHSAERMIGVFPAKTCEFELLNRVGDISLNGKEVTVYRGLEIDGETEWIPMGVFSAADDNITNELTKRTIRFKGTDRSAVFDTQFVNDITYPCTVLEFVQYICERHGVTLETENFPFADRLLLSAPNADSSVSERELIARIAELGGCIAQISRKGGLCISRPCVTGKTVKKKYYKTVSKEPKFGEITAVTLGHKNYTDDIVYPKNAAESAINWRIEDNPFVDGAIAAADGVTPSTRQTLIADIADNIIGMSLVPFGVTDFVDDFVFDLGDIVTVEEKNGSTFETVILNVSTASRIKSSLGASTQTQGQTNYSIAGSTKQMLKKIKLEVDHQAGLIKGIVEDADGLKTTVEQLSTEVKLKFENLTDPDHLDIEHVTSISAEGVKIYNGKIEIFNADNKKIFGTDDDGALDVTGNICVKFRNASGTDTATLKITNEDYKNDTADYATASIKVTDSSGSVFSDISMWEYEGLGTTSITSDNITLGNEAGTLGINIGGGTGIAVLGGLNVLTGDIEAYNDVLVRGALKSSSASFCGFQHTRSDNTISATLKPGIGVANTTNSVNFSDNNLATTKKIESDSGIEYNAVVFSSKKLIQLSKLRPTSGYNRVNVSFKAGKYGWTKYYFAYTTADDSTLKQGELLLDLFSNSKNNLDYSGIITFPNDATQWCIAVYPDMASSNYWAGWRDVKLSEMFTAPTAALELDTTDSDPSVICRLDCFATNGEAYVAIQGRKGNSSSKRLELGADNLYWDGGIVAERVEGSSAASLKTNIQPALSMLDKVCESGIYSYNYKSELRDKSQNALAPRYGLVIGDGYNTPEEVISSDGKHIDLYSMIAIAWKAIQELADKFDTEVNKNA